MTSKEEKNSDTLLYQIPTTLLGEFLEPRKEAELLKGLNAMFTNYFKDNRYFDQNDDTESVLEAYHFCNHFLSNKNLFNSKNVA
jgi:hypothetical protein